MYNFTVLSQYLLNVEILDDPKLTILFGHGLIFDLFIKLMNLKIL